MAIVKWRNWNPYTDLADSIEKLFNEGLIQNLDESPRIWAPAVDVVEEETAYLIKADIPGLTREDVHVEVDKNTLTIRGEKKEEKEEKGKRYYRKERTHGTFTRSFSLPDNVDADSIKAVHKEGVLELTIPKKEKEKPRKIEVSVN